MLGVSYRIDEGGDPAAGDARRDRAVLEGVVQGEKGGAGQACHYVRPLLTVKGAIANVG